MSARGDPPPSARTQAYLGGPTRGGRGDSSARQAVSPRRGGYNGDAPPMSSRSRSNPPGPDVGSGAAGRYGAITPRTMRNRQRAYGSDGEVTQSNRPRDMSNGPTPRAYTGAGGPTPRVTAGAGPTPRVLSNSGNYTGASGPTPRMLGAPHDGGGPTPRVGGPGPTPRMLSPGRREMGGQGPSPRPSARSPGAMSARPGMGGGDGYSGGGRWDMHQFSARTNGSGGGANSVGKQGPSTLEGFGNFGMTTARVAQPPSSSYAPPYSRDDFKIWRGVNHWTTSTGCALCEMPVFCLSACMLPCVCVFKQRKALLNHRMIDYECCAGTCGRYHTDSCNKWTRGNEEFCLGAEVIFCLGCAIHGNRWMLMQYYNLENDFVDSLVLVLSYLCLPLSFFMQDDALENLADVAYMPCAGCAVTQLNHHVKVFGFAGFKPQDME
jgi:hypothetical protein